VTDPAPTGGLGWSQEVVLRAILALEPAADAQRASAMAAYMGQRFPFLGIGAPVRAGLLHTAWAGLPDPTPADLAEAAASLWRLHGREYQYAACDLLASRLAVRRPAAVGAQFLVEAVQPLLTSKAWWDSVDALRAAAVGPLVAAHPELAAVQRQWVQDDDRWLVRTALTHQIGYGVRTDEALLLELCARRAADPDRFVAKAVGWALRSHARHRPDVVRRFCAEHPELTVLARREALRHLG
jgi:3-methyladenine DNA glycosylase AlkD